MSDGSPKVRSAASAAWVVAIVLVSTTLAMTFSWRASGMSLYARDRLMQARGPMAPPDDIVIVAIDDLSIARYGRFPWPRSLTTHVIDTIASAQPKAIAIDILYSEPTSPSDDTAMADAIKRAGNAVVAAQLIETTDEKGSAVVSWLRPLPLIENYAAGVGHVNVSTEADGAARELSLRKSDDQGQALWSIAVESVRVGEGIRATSVRDVPGGVVLGSRTIPTMADGPTDNFASRHGNSRTEISRPDRMMIDYAGPPGSFAHQTFSLADVLDGRVTPQSFRGKYILIGATAATLGDHVASPFVHAEGPRGQQHGELMPGVEVLANSINTILRSRFYREAPEWLAALLAAMVAAVVVGLLAVAQGRFEAVKQLAALLGIFALVIGLSYIAFARWLFVAPLVPALISFGVAVPLSLLRRSLSTSSDLDTRIAELANANNLLFVSTAGHGRSDTYTSPAALIAQLTGAKTVAIYVRFENDEGYRLLIFHGSDPAPARLTENGIETQGQCLVLRSEDEQPSGLLLIKDAKPNDSSAETLRLCVEIATSAVNNVDEQPKTLTSGRWQLPRGVEWKARALGILNRRLLSRARFIDRALRAVDDGLIVSDIAGRIVFANPRAAEILDIRQRVLIGSNLFQQLTDIQPQKESVARESGSLAREMLVRSIVGRVPVERQITVGNPPRYYMLRLSAVTSRDDEKGSVLGLVAALSDVTQQHELEEMRADVMTLVSHELLTPLTAIQGMSEVLAQFEVPDERRREMHRTINDEAKRLAHMISEYLDIAKLESGRRVLRLAPLAPAPLVQRVVLLLEPLAAQRNIRIVRDLATALPVIMADADLIAQALTNLIANAIKYSPSNTDIVITARVTLNTLLIGVKDQGYGIPADVLPHVFEKFYRVPRLEDADVPGTGLGLTLVREIVELHGGHVTVDSELGVGSSFSVSLPLPATKA
jgi:signal transduction histidine kinase/CHASE2 domain-containing sensor protein